MKFLNVFTLVFPKGEYPAEGERCPEGEETGGPFELYEMDWGEKPSCGDTYTVDDGVFKVVEVQTYAPITDSSVEAVYVAICSRSGNKPERSRDTLPSSYIPGYLAVELQPDGSIDQEGVPWWYGNPEIIPRSNSKVDVTRFNPADEHAQEYSAVVLLQSAQVAVAV